MSQKSLLHSNPGVDANTKEKSDISINTAISIKTHSRRQELVTTWQGVHDTLLGTLEFQLCSWLQVPAKADPRRKRVLTHVVEKQLSIWKTLYEFLPLLLQELQGVG